MLAFPPLLCYTLFMKYSYSALYEKNAAFYNARPLLKKGLFFLNLVLTLAFFVGYGAFVLCAIALEYPAEDLTRILGAPALCLFLVSLLRLAIYRPRPYSENGADIIPLYPKKGSLEHSFPSRHVACALVIAITFLPYSVGAGICSIALGFLLSYVRFALGVHYPTDLLGGAILGTLCGMLTFVF